MTSVGDEFPKEQARVRELLGEYKAIGPAGALAVALIEAILKRADEAMAGGDVVAILVAFGELRECTG